MNFSQKKKKQIKKYKKVIKKIGSAKLGPIQLNKWKNLGLECISPSCPGSANEHTSIECDLYNRPERANSTQQSDQILEIRSLVKRQMQFTRGHFELRHILKDTSMIFFYSWPLYLLIMFLNNA